ncbi:DegT/DnrJ/EryC1/StrS family aminotransferase [Nocardia sp. NPDC059240]|uniref:DegT/DnrJ/EryC1/StrS family aminotransferase n=1 Tax=Nocardia sp. NPDC059240 TaxID=3346786 RepID=UPI0036A93074
MSTAEDDRRTAATHPDERLMARVRSALDRWGGHPAAVAPTSSILGTGAIAAVEAAMSAHHNDIPAILLPSASYALGIALSAIGVGAGDEVLLPALDWPASFAAVANLGAQAIPIAVDPATLTIDPNACAAVVTPRTAAIIASHLHGVCADIPAIRAAAPHLPVIEDCAAALGSSIDGLRTGTMGDLAVISFGPGKRIDAGEGGVLLVRDPQHHRRALSACVHPLRATLLGLEADHRSTIMRPHPLTAMLALDALAQWDPRADEKAHRDTARELSEGPAVELVGHDSRRTNAGPTIPILATGKQLALHGKTNAVVLPGSNNETMLHDLADRLRLLPTTGKPNSGEESGCRVG